MSSSALRDERDALRLEELRRCRSSLWYLLVEYLERGFNPGESAGLTGRMHLPVCSWLDRHRSESKIAFWCRRGWHKSTIIEGLLIQEWLRDPLRSHYYWAGGPQLVGNMVSSLEQHLRYNEKLRALDPVGVDPRDGKAFRIFPRKNAKFSTFQQGSGSIKTYRPYGYRSKSRTIELQTAATESTGAHVDGVGIFDDIIGRNTIERSGLSGIAEWVRSTAYNVVDSKRFRSVGTPWSEQSIHQEWMTDPTWRTLVLPGAIVESDEVVVERLKSDEMKLHFTACYQFTNPTFWPVDWAGRARKRLREDQHDQKGNFAPQIMCDPEPAAEKPWGSDCEHFTGIQPSETMPGILGPGTTFVLSDPAPYLQGGYKGLTEKQRGDGTKDYWSIEVWKIRPRGDIQDFIFLDGSHSQEWEKVQGCDEAARLMKKWRTNLFFSESADEYHAEMLAACLRASVSLRRRRDSGPLKFAEYNKADGKNSRFVSLAGKARLGEVWISSETVPREILHGDTEHTGFLTQARKWRKIAPGKNSLRFDDDADCGSRITDAALLEFAPRPDALRQREWEKMFEEDSAADADTRSRYCGL